MVGSPLVAQLQTQAFYPLLTDLLDAGRQATLKHWGGDERKVWMPLTLAVPEDEHDSQAELDGLIERMEKKLNADDEVL